ncbi:MAG: DUF1641 domain-containing protein [Alphaproteobacteria bacterium]|nr:DUF1641 domain-containing protein [Alphaproteobacteria bacterium]MCB9793825.1 DUF1641 domain-containing protein [Alphaproteobacteria bacterium]
MSDPSADLSRLVALMEGLDARLARLEGRVESLAQQLDHIPAGVAAVTDTVDHHVAALQQRGVDVDERLRVALSLTERLTRPDTAAAVEQALELSEQLPGGAAMVVDTLDGLMSKVVAQGIDIDERLRMLAAATEALTRPSMLKLVNALLDRGEDLERVISVVLESGVLDAPAVSVVGDAGSALATSRDETLRPVGAFGALRQLSDPDVGLAVAFGLQFTKRFGALLRDRGHA